MEEVTLERAKKYAETTKEMLNASVESYKELSNKSNFILGFYGVALTSLLATINKDAQSLYIYMFLVVLIVSSLIMLVGYTSRVYYSKGNESSYMYNDPFNKLNDTEYYEHLASTYERNAYHNFELNSVRANRIDLSIGVFFYLSALISATLIFDQLGLVDFVANLFS